MKRLSAIVITKNEASQIGDCLRALGFADEIIVLDSGSTDATVALARDAGARVAQTTDWPGFGIQKNRALDLAQGEWVLSIDADERVSSALRDQILATLHRPTHNAYTLSRKSSYCGQFMRHSGWYPDPVLRLFKRGSARFSDDLVHESLRYEGPVGHLEGELLHESFADLEVVIQKMDRYSSASARTLHLRGVRGSLGKALGHGLWAFLRTYLLQAGFLDGRLGVALAISNAEGTYYRYLKLWLLQRRP
jgi:glycosyltransferase involved in cell wall biosynthesis